MTTTAAGDAAVARLNKATEAFEKIITGASNQVVDVPGYGNQPTLAARVDERLDETTATAAAEADRSRDEADRATIQANAAANSVTKAIAEYNKAKTQADRAQSEADRAAQITGLETVADAIGMAALPLPDVWAPLSDSLRLITGYGRDVLVGSDVVARMVNFSRNSTATYIGKDGLLKTAAANEPRFEKEGLLIEGQSTNVFNGVAGASYNWLGSGLTQSAGTAQLPFDVFQKTITSSAFSPTNTGRVLADIYSILNPVASGGGPVTASVIMFGDADAILAADPRMNITSNLPITNITYSAVKLNSGMVRVMWTGTVPAGSATNFPNFQVSWLNRLPSVVVGCYQVETLPFASSYIPTNGTAVTRAADVCFIPERQNIYSGGTNVSFCCEVDTKGGNNRIFEAGDSTMFHMNEASFSGRVSQISTIPIFNSYILGSRAIVAASISPARVTSRLNGIVVSGAPSTAGSADFARLQFGNRSGTLDRPLNGHIRNFRIWHSALTDEQIKALK